MQYSTVPDSVLTPCLLESIIFSESGDRLDSNPGALHNIHRKQAIVDLAFHEHEQRWIEMCEEVSFPSALRYLRTRMFIDKNMMVIVDESQVHQLALALYRYRSGDIVESIQDKEFVNNNFDWNETVMDDLSISPVLPE
jgi:hypothetical protein